MMASVDHELAEVSFQTKTARDSSYSKDYSPQNRLEVKTELESRFVGSLRFGMPLFYTSSHVELSSG